MADNDNYDNSNLIWKIDGLADDFYRLENRVNSMDIEINKLTNNTSVVNALMLRMESAYKDTTQSLNKSAEAINLIGITLVGIKNTLQVTSELKTEISGIKKKFEDAEDKNKIDFRLIVKEILTNKIIWILGAGTVVFEYIRSNWEAISKSLFK